MLKISKHVISSICTDICALPIENGGIIGRNKKGIITDYYFDYSSSRGFNQYTPDTQKLNTVIRQWSEQKIEFCGIVHSHPMEIVNLSRADIEYAVKVLNSFESLKYLYMIVVTPESKKSFLSTYKVFIDGACKHERWSVF